MFLSPHPQTNLPRKNFSYPSSKQKLQRMGQTNPPNLRQTSRGSLQPTSRPLHHLALIPIIPSTILWVDFSN